MRLDGDTFFSTFEAIELLYPKLAPGGFLIVDDYMDWLTCRAAIDQYRSEHGITEHIIAVPHGPGEAVRGVYRRKQPAAGQALCASCPQGPGALRPAGALLEPGPGATPVTRGVKGPLGERLDGVWACMAPARQKGY